MKVFITGGSGFLGRALMHYWGDDEVAFTVYSRDEYKQDLCKRNYSSARYILGDVRDIDRMSLAMAGHDLVIHAAAIKYIPEAEANVNECIAVNVEGSSCVLRAARAAGVDRVVGISTDKAVQPVNTYGASKMLMERLFDEAARYGQYTTLVRYGNVVGSTGSVIPKFKRQFKEDGTITITDPGMTRFWISAEDAVDLVKMAWVNEPGTITVPRAGAMEMGPLAHLIAGNSFKVVGARPGEKFSEDMIHPYESVRTIVGKNNYIVMPVGTCAFNNEFKISSDHPDFWINDDQMKRYIELAEALP